MWHDTQKPIQLSGLFLKGITQFGGGQGDAHRTLGCGKSMHTQRAYGRSEGKYLKLDEGLLNRKRNENSYRAPAVVKMEYNSWWHTTAGV